MTNAEEMRSAIHELNEYVAYIKANKPKESAPITTNNIKDLDGDKWVMLIMMTQFAHSTMERRRLYEENVELRKIKELSLKYFRMKREYEIEHEMMSERLDAEADKIYNEILKAEGTTRFPHI